MTAEFADAYLRTAVALGRYDWVTVVDGCVEDLEAQIDPAEVRELVSRHFAAHLDQQARWPERTDSDRLTDAFRALDAAGVTAREDFTCCQNCGAAEIAAEIGDTPARGYVFYHQQDAERAAEGGSLWLAYGLVGQPPSVEVGREITAALRSEGLHVDWDESAGRRIHVRLRWARRRLGRMAAYPVGLRAADIDVEVVRGRHRIAPRLPDTVVQEVELPWLPENVALRLTRGGLSVVVHREFDRLVCDDGRVTGRFEGLRLLADEEILEPPPEPGLLEVTFQGMHSGPRQSAGRPMTVPETMAVLRRLPTRTDSWLCALGRSGGIVQMRCEDGRLWLETPEVAACASVGRFGTLAEAERMLAVLADEDRVAIRELTEVTVRPW